MLNVSGRRKLVGQLVRSDISKLAKQSLNIIVQLVVRVKSGLLDPNSVLNIGLSNDRQERLKLQDVQRSVAM